MLVFIIPVKSKEAATSWPELCKLFERSLQSVCNQSSSNFRVIIVCNERPEIQFHHPHVEYLEVNFPIPKATYNARVDDRAKRVVAGLLAAKEIQPRHVMSVDADDCVSKHLAEFVSKHPGQNGWFLGKGLIVKEMAVAIFKTLKHPLPKETLKQRAEEFTLENSVKKYSQLLRLVSQ